MLLFFLLFLIGYIFYFIYGSVFTNNKRTHVIHIYKKDWFAEDVVPLKRLKVRYVRVHDTVIFVNKDNVRHTVITHDEDIKNSKILQTHDEYKIQFHRVGRYEFLSSLYPFMHHIRIVVLPINVDDQKWSFFRKKIKL